MKKLAMVIKGEDAVMRDVLEYVARGFEEGHLKLLTLEIKETEDG